MLKLFVAQVVPTHSTEGEYQLGESTECEYASEWVSNFDDADGIQAYIINATDDLEGIEFTTDNPGNVHSFPGGVLLLLDGNPKEVYWAEEI